MNWLRDLPLKRKLTLVILSTCTSVLLLACALLAAYQLYDSRQALIRGTSVLADVLAENTRAALAFQDDNAAQKTLMALESEPYVSAASLYDARGKSFAIYTRAGATAIFPVKPGNDGHRFEHGYLVLFRPIILNDKRIGTIYVQTNLQAIYNRLELFGVISLMVLLGSLFAALGISAPLQRPISRPIVALAETVRVIAEKKDYKVRVPPQGRNETGLLTDAFNQLLGSIEERDTTLRATNESLKTEITERKGAERKLQDQLTRLALLHQITRATSERQDLQSIFQVVLRSLEDSLPIDFGCVGIYEKETNTLLVTQVGVRNETLIANVAITNQMRVEIGQNGLAQCVSGRLVYEPDVAHSEYPFPKKLASAGLGSMVAAPLLVESKVFGVLIATRQQVDGFSSGECEFLRQLSEHVGLAAHQAQLYEALQQAYDDLRQTQQAVMQQERLKALGQMASGIAHDINNAISPVALYTESLLEKEPNLSPRARDYLTTIQHAIEDVSHTVARMREFYRQRETPLTLSAVKLNPLIRQVLDLSRARWSDMPQQRGIFIKVETDFADELPIIMGVESEIREALVNLVFNAVDAMPEGGTLTLRTKVSPGQPLVHLEVCDSGVGMDDDTRRRCLEPFFTTKGERGTGLGLAMVYGIVRRHNADIEIESQVGKGTIVRLSFPLPTSISEASQAAAPPYAVPTRRRILVVDDDPLLIKSLRDTLETDGHVVTTASGGKDGIGFFQKALASNERFDVVITDLGMPYVDGRQVAAAIKAASPSTPVIMLTGWGQRLVAEGDVPTHVDQVLNKPPKLRELRDALVHCLPPGKI